jgi:hypothetical protein
MASKIPVGRRLLDGIRDKSAGDLDLGFPVSRQMCNDEGDKDQCLEHNLGQNRHSGGKSKARTVERH